MDFRHFYRVEGMSDSPNAGNIVHSTYIWWSKTATGCVFVYKGRPEIDGVTRFV